MGNKWLEIDKEGMAQIVRRRGPAFLPMELLGNSLDTDAKTISISFEAVHNRSLINVRIEDDDPTGFVDLRDAYTLYKPSRRRGDPNKRGRFNIGEKEVLALCESAVIHTTTGTIVFDKDGTRKRKTDRRDVGTVFRASVKMTREEAREAIRAVTRIVPPDGVSVMLSQKGIMNDCGPFGAVFQVEGPEIVGEFRASLPTELEDEEGNLRPTRRHTLVRVYNPKKCDVPMLYEMGIPVCELPEDKWHMDVQQKIPLPRDRDSVRPSFLQKLRVAVLNNLHEKLEQQDASRSWVQEAAASDDVEKESLTTVLAHQFGDDRVSFSPRDPEASKRAASGGSVVIYGNSVSGKMWDNIRKHDLVESAEVQYGTKKPEFSVDGIDVRIPKDKYTAGMKLVTGYAERIGQALLGFVPTVLVVRDQHNRRFRAWYGGKRLAFNLATCGHRLFNEFPKNMDELNDLLIHEFGHEYCSDHLSSAYHNALTGLGAKMTRLALENPGLFDVNGQPEG